MFVVDNNIAYFTSETKKGQKVNSAKNQVIEQTLKNCSTVTMKLDEARLINFAIASLK